MPPLTLTFISANPLDTIQRKLFKDHNLGEYPTKEEIYETTLRWRQLWQEVDHTHGLLTYLETATQRRPVRNLECFVYGRGLGAMSAPFLLPVINPKGNRWTDEMFVQVVVHELLHIFLATDNNAYWRYVRDYYQAEEISCQNHIALYAFLYDICQRFFKCEPIDFGRDNLPPGYARAIAIVKETGYQDIIRTYHEKATLELQSER